MLHHNEGCGKAARVACPLFPSSFLFVGGAAFLPLLFLGGAAFLPLPLWGVLLCCGVAVPSSFGVVWCCFFTSRVVLPSPPSSFSR